MEEQNEARKLAKDLLEEIDKIKGNINKEVDKIGKDFWDRLNKIKTYKKY